MMKRIYAVTAFFYILCLALPLAAVAGPIGGLSYNIARDHFSFSLAASVSYGQRDVRVIENKDIQDELNSWQILTKLDIAPIKYVDVYGLFGAADMQFDDSDFNGPLNTAYGGGIRPMLFPLIWKSNLNICLDGQYLAYATTDNGVQAIFQNAQAALVFSYILRSFVPYGGVKYDYALVKFEGAQNDLQGDIVLAVFVGCDYFVTPSIFFNVDLAIFSETRIVAGVGFKY